MVGPAVTENVSRDVDDRERFQCSAGVRRTAAHVAFGVCTWRSHRRRPRVESGPVSGVRADAQTPPPTPTNAIYGWRDLGNVLFFPIVFSIFCREPVVFLYLKEN